MKQPNPVNSSAGSAALLHNVNDSCALLGMSRSTVERLRKAGAFPAPIVNRGRLVLFSLASLQLFAANGIV